jgi:histone-lysine N-methyltransferase SETMAR
MWAGWVRHSWRFGHAEGHQGSLVLSRKCPAYRALAIQKKLAYLGFQCLDYPPYSPDLAPSDYHLFPGLKNNWKVAIFRPTQSLLPRRPGWKDKFLISFLSGFQKLEQRAKKCIELRGEYVEWVQWLPGLSRVLSTAGAWRWPITPFQCRSHGRVELYLYPPSRPPRACNGVT